MTIEGRWRASVATMPTVSPVVHEPIGELASEAPAEPRPKMSVRQLHKALTETTDYFRYSHLYKGGFEDRLKVFRERVNEAQSRVRKRRGGLAAEVDYPTGEALLWYLDVLRYVPRSGQAVAKQIARLCGGDTQVTIPWRSLADAVGMRDKDGRARAYTERGVQTLADAGWLRVETVGQKRGAKTTFYLMPGDLADWCEDEPLRLEDVTG